MPDDSRNGWTMSRSITIAPEAAPRAPARALPAGTIDCHTHIFEHFERFPLANERSYQPPPCTREALLALHAMLGVARGVHVHASPYGFDNALAVDFLASHPGRFVGVAAVGPDADDALIARLDAAGFRAARLMDQHASGATTRDLEAVAARIAPYGWHIEINIAKSADWVELEPRLRRCPVPIVFDHLGRVRGGEGVNAPGFAVVRRLLAERDDCWTKISSWYRLSDLGPPHYRDMRPLVRALLEERPDRCVWGSNWPHPGMTRFMPGDAELIDLLESWLPGDRVREPLYAANAARLYRFDAKVLA